ncbi:unnamed protein product [Parnassius apollo]|uniref:(apollo) hypothetical protein n=1 Tax=Parnassius apollo TaxID=110799 RepID=A0A8S3XVM9_PARAO|nr:unnamed protein product [Parnassius apollo]
MHLIQWNPFTTENKGPFARSNRFRLHFVNIMDRPKCINYMAPVVDLRSYEFCVTLQDRVNVNFEHGAALLQGYNVTGFFSWGERQGKTLPFIIVYIPKFKDWLEDIVSLQNILL